MKKGIGFLIILLAQAVFAADTLAAVYKCVGADGRVEFSDQPCAEGNSVPLELHDQTISTSDGAASSGRVQKRKTTSRLAEQDDSAVNKKAVKETQDKKTGRLTAEKEREQKASERRFISTSMSASDVRTRIGAPGRQEVNDCSGRATGTAKKGRKVGGSSCGRCWVYAPAENDPQTQTQVCFDNDQKVSSVKRTVIR